VGLAILPAEEDENARQADYESAAECHSAPLGLSTARDELNGKVEKGGSSARMKPADA
jgi:hypothetical protein